MTSGQNVDIPSFSSWIRSKCMKMLNFRTTKSLLNVLCIGIIGIATINSVPQVNAADNINEFDQEMVHQIMVKVEKEMNATANAYQLFERMEKVSGKPKTCKRKIPSKLMEARKPQKIEIEYKMDGKKLQIQGIQISGLQSGGWTVTEQDEEIFEEFLVKMYKKKSGILMKWLIQRAASTKLGFEIDDESMLALLTIFHIYQNYGVGYIRNDAEGNAYYAKDYVFNRKDGQMMSFEFTWTESDRQNIRKGVQFLVIEAINKMYGKSACHMEIPETLQKSLQQLPILSHLVKGSAGSRRRLLNNDEEAQYWFGSAFGIMSICWMTATADAGSTCAFLFLVWLVCAIIRLFTA